MPNNWHREWGKLAWIVVSRQDTMGATSPNSTLSLLLTTLSVPA